MGEEQTAATQEVLERFYASYTRGNLAGMLALMAEDAVVTFVGHGTFRGKGEIAAYMTWAGTQLPKLNFRVLHTIVDDEYAAVPWDEDGVTKRGDRWTARGVDVFRVESGKIAELTVHSDTDKMRRLLDPYRGPSASGHG